MATLSKHRDELQTVIRTYKSLFETTEQLIKELKSKISIIIIQSILYSMVILGTKEKMTGQDEKQLI